MVLAHVYFLDSSSSTEGCWAWLANLKNRRPRRRPSRSYSLNLVRLAVGKMSHEGQHRFVFVDRLESRYRMLEMVGSGSYGEIWKAARCDDPVQKGAYALKVFDKAPSSWLETSQQTLTEAFVLSGVAVKLQHPNIVRFLEFVVDESRSIAGRARLIPVMEALHGPDLFDWLAERQAAVATGKVAWINESEVLHIAVQVLNGLAYIHGGSPYLVHRDLKPENLRWASYCLGSNLKLVDFGTLFVSGFEDPSEGRIVGTGLYRAPELFCSSASKSGAPGTALDMYSFGVVLFLLVSGCFPQGVGVDAPVDISTFPWRQVPARNTELLRSLLDASPEKRLAAKDCLAHQCFTAPPSGTQLNAPQEPVESLRKLSESVLSTSSSSYR